MQRQSKTEFGSVFEKEIGPEVLPVFGSIILGELVPVPVSWIEELLGTPMSKVIPPVGEKW
jgi:hypothetical protein